MVQPDSTMWTGLSGVSYPFWTYAPDAIFYDVSAVYIFVKLEQQTNLWVPLYIGESAMLAARLWGHEKLPCAWNHGMTHIHVHSVGDDLTRESIERDLINLHRPICNG